MDRFVFDARTVHSVAEISGHFLDRELLKIVFQKYLFLDSHALCLLIIRTLTKLYGSPEKFINRLMYNLLLCCVSGDVHRASRLHNCNPCTSRTFANPPLGREQVQTLSSVLSTAFSTDGNSKIAFVLPRLPFTVVYIRRGFYERERSVNCSVRVSPLDLTILE